MHLPGGDQILVMKSVYRSSQGNKTEEIARIHRQIAEILGFLT